MQPDALLGREKEFRQVTDVVAAASSGAGGVLVLSGEAGIGKTALLERAARAAAGFQVLRASGAEFEQELPYAALHQLCVPVLRHAGEIPQRHREALRVAFGLTAGTPDPFRVGLAVLELIAAAARDRPLLCVVDDAQWLDAASSKALVFLARRIAADAIAILLAVRAPVPPLSSNGPAGELAALPELVVGALSDESARQLLTARSPVALDERVRDRLVAEANGNPLALLELPRAGGFALPETGSVSNRVEQAFQGRLRDLSAGARLLLTVASADPTGDPALLWPAVRLLGVAAEPASAEAEATGLAEFSTRVRFCHPLARSAVYRAAGAAERRAAHGALAEITDPFTAPDRRAWHRAQATVSPNAEIAADLQRCAARAQARGGMAAAAAFRQRAAELTPEAGERIDRTMDAAEAHLAADDTGAAEALLTTVETADLDDFRRARVELLHGRIAFTRPGDGTGPALMAAAARRLAALDVRRARECYLDALEASLLAGRGGGFVPRILTAARSAPPADSPDMLAALLRLDAGEHRAVAPMLAELLHADRRPMWTRWAGLASMISTELWDPHATAIIAQWLVKAGRESGSPTQLRLGLAQTATDATFTGNIGLALAALAEEGAIADAAGAAPLVYPRLQLAALRGRRAEARSLFEAAGRAVTADGAGQVTNLDWTTAMLHNGLGDYPAALAAARRATAPGRLFLAGVALPELIEAAVRCREDALAAEAMASLTERTEASGTPAGRGIAAYARGLVTGVEDHFREAVERLAETPLVPHRGRAHLLYGEWLRRQGRRRDGVGQLRLAHELLDAAGADSFARRAAEELRACGEGVRQRAEKSFDSLTAQEAAVARLVASGATSNEAAVQLFISKRTVDAHLRNIFRKLGVSSRRQLKGHPAVLAVLA
ncbi:LuxR family transcriptional regulator [Virgisporangium aliadipatigenens]|uniref:LuxR family transcriptional regulator n=1 Tax=Virgisporangium aliadipatigenens TaxID=741659 RepID=A0A8J3YIR5_9ACTN|nr:LuxR family transcriptional regulator [Virgisporangium aliadipatigenens]GIJ46094.1 LuxR family transcriptional regulator [Virgisporangium aliadipatigenens]